MPSLIKLVEFEVEGFLEGGEFSPKGVQLLQQWGAFGGREDFFEFDERSLMCG